MELDVHNVWVAISKKGIQGEYDVGKQKARYWIGHRSGDGRRGWPVVGAEARAGNAAIRHDAGQ